MHELRRLGTARRRPALFEQIKEKASKIQQVIETTLANPKHKFKIGIRKLIEGLMIQRRSNSPRKRLNTAASSGFSSYKRSEIAESALTRSV